MQAKDIMTANVVTVEPNTSVQDIAKLLIENRISAVPVTEKNGRLIGIVSEGDLMRRPDAGTEKHPSWWLAATTRPELAAQKYIKTHGKHAADVMTKNVITIDENTPIQEIAEILEKNLIKRVPVLKEGKIVGIVSRANLLRALATQRPVAVPTDDRIAKEAIERAISEAGVRSTFIHVIVSDGVAHLWGIAETPEEKAAAHVAAETAPGVKEVRDNIGFLPATARAVLWV